MKRKIRGFLLIVLAVVVIKNSVTAFAENEFSGDTMPMEMVESAEQQNTYINDIGSNQSMEDGDYRIDVAGNRALKREVSGMSAGDGANV